MKHYRVLSFFDFDMRVRSLDPIQDHWEEVVKDLARERRAQTITALYHEFGERNADNKIQNFIDLGPKPMSVLAFHNAFFAQIRTAFVMRSYYPALTAACALGERILNHLILELRDQFRGTPEYREVYRKQSFDDWSIAINTLASWDVILPTAVDDFRLLMDRRHRALHFRPEVDTNARALALEAVLCLQRIIGEQFSAFGAQPWFMTDIPGESYIKQQWEGRPFIQRIYIPNAVRVGPRHRIESVVPHVSIIDPDHEIDLGEATDEEFAAARVAFNAGGQQA